MASVSTWSGVAEAYRTSFATLCAGPVERLIADTPDGRHLDVGCGTGDLALGAASLGRTVVAVDADPDMVAMASGIVPGRVLEASLPSLPFGDDGFDAVTANFVVNHVGDPRAAMRELARVTRAGGRVAVTTWTSRPTVWASMVNDAFDAAGAVPAPGQRLAPDLDFERSVSGLSGLAEEAGLDVVTATELTWEWEIEADALWAGIAGGVASVGATYLAQTPGVQTAIEKAFREAVSGPLTLASTAAYVVGEPR